MKRYIPSGSGAEAGHTQKSSFRFYARMQFLDEVMPVTPYVIIIIWFIYIYIYRS